MTNDSRTHNENTYKYKFEGAEFDEAAMTLTVDGQRIELERKPLDLLLTLLRHVDEVMTKEELLELVWPDQVTVPNVLANAIAKLRKAIGEKLAARIKTQPRIGYRFIGPIERIRSGRHPTSQLNITQGAPIPGRPHFSLEIQLSSQPEREVWLAKHSKTQEQRIFKFASDGLGLAALKREVTLFRVLNKSLTNSEQLVHIYDWNFENAPFFIESEYGGEDLLSWHENNSLLTTMPEEERIELALKIIDAVANVHSVGVLHKDLKPANILIKTTGGRISIKLADFGSASLLNDQNIEAMGLTLMGFTINDRNLSELQLGTLFYTAPEVAEGHSPGMASDIYALGIILYQIVAAELRRPLSSGWQNTIDNDLLCEDIHLATHGDPAKRISSAAELARNIRRLDVRREKRQSEKHLAQKVIESEARLSRIHARRPWVFAASAILVLGALTSSWLAFIANDSRQQAELKTQQAQLSQDFLNEILLSADPRAPGATADASVRTALERASNMVNERFKDQPLTLAQLSVTLGDVYAGLADNNAALEARKQAAKLFLKHLPADDERTLLSQYKIANSHILSGNGILAANLMRDIEEKVSIKNMPPKVQGFAKQTHGILYLSTHKFEKAAERFESALAHYAMENPKEVKIIHMLRLNLAQCYSRINRKKDAELLLAQLLQPPFNDANIIPKWRQANTRTAFGAALMYNNRLDAAESELKRANKETALAYGEDNFRVVEVNLILAENYLLQQNYPESLALLNSARPSICGNRARKLHCGWTIGKIGEVQLLLGKIELASHNLASALEKTLAVYGKKSPVTEVINFHLATALLEENDLKKSREIIDQLDINLLKSGDANLPWKELLAAQRGRLLVQESEVEKGGKMIESATARLREAEVPEITIAIYEKVL